MSSCKAIYESNLVTILEMDDVSDVTQTVN